MPFVYLKVAEGGVYVQPTLVQTVLGSCLGAAFHAPAKGIGGFFHAFLPKNEEYPQYPGASVFRFVDTAIDHMLAAFARNGITPGALAVSLMGCSNGMAGQSQGVGIKNIEAAYEILEKHRLKPGFADLGGAAGRKVFFHSGTGEIKITKLESGAKCLLGPKGRAVKAHPRKV